LLTYVEKPDDAKLIGAAIKGMLAGLDPHSRYLDAWGFRDAQVDTLGKFGGLGLEIASENGRIKVISAIDETPAAQAGIIGGEIIIRIDDEPVDGLNFGALGFVARLDELAGSISGPVTTKTPRRYRMVSTVICFLGSALKNW
jgi:carboxyl-terminal processing protease